MNWNNELKNMPLINTWLYPKDLDLAAEFVEEKVKHVSDIIIYGGGTHTLALFDKLSDKAKCKIKKILDLIPVGKNFNVPVIHPKVLKVDNLDFDKIVLSHYDSEDSMKQYLTSIGIEVKDILPIYTNPDYHSMVEKKYKWIDGIEFNKDSKNVVTFVSLQNNLKIFLDEGIRLLRKTGNYKTVNLNMCREFLKTDGIYDCEFDCKRSIYLLCRFIEKISPDIIYVHDELETLYFLPKVLKKFYPKIKIIWEPYDLLILSCRSKRENNKRWSDEEFQFAMENERYNLENIDGVVYKESGKLANDVYHVERKRPSLNFYQYLPKKIKVCFDIKYEEPFKLVYAGSIHLFTIDNQINYYPRDEFGKILAQGIHVDLYVNANKDEIRLMYQDYVSLKKIYNEFGIFPRKDICALVKLIGKKCHFGYFVATYDSSADVGKRIYSTVFSGKIWAYIFAGLPVIIKVDGEERVGMGALLDFIVKHGIGIYYNRDDNLSDILRRIKPDEYYAMKKRVCLLADKFCMENKIHEMDNFMKVVRGR